MNIEYRKEYSNYMGRDMEYKLFGSGGKICIVFPCQNGRFYDYEDFGMVDVLVPEIEEEKLLLVCVDSIDGESICSQTKPYRERIEAYERWHDYIMFELIPRLQHEYGNYEGMLTTGCSMGAYHAANFYFRHPDRFDSVIALSGLYHGSYLFGDYMDDLVYLNSPIESLSNMPKGHPYMNLYRKNKMIFCVGQGAWEDELLDSTRRLDAVLRSKGIPAWIDYWGYDVNHDWDWWKKQMRYFIGQVV